VDTCLLVDVAEADPRFQGILTRNEADFHQVFPTLKVLAP
jgi:hypothetical protein